MLLNALLLSAVLVPQEPAANPAQSPAPKVLAVKRAGSMEDAPPAVARPATIETGPVAAGLAAFRAHHLRAARAELEKAVAADPQSAAAAFYLGYAYYKIGEPSRRMDANKEKARELFARAFSLDPAFKPAWR